MPDDQPILRSRQSINVWGDYPNDPEWRAMRAPLERFNASYVSMLYQDLRTQLYLGGYSDRHAFRVQVLGEDTESMRSQLAQALGYRTGYGLTEAVREFFQQSGADMLLCGSTTYEIDYLTDSETGASAGFQLVPLPLCAHVIRRGKHYQFLPDEVAASEGKPRMLELDPNRLIELTFARSRRKELDRALDDLSDLSSWILKSTDLVIESQQAGFPYDAAAHNDMVDRALAKVTRPIGWDVRQSLLQKWSEPLLLTRALRFRLFAIEIRDLIHARLNDALAEIGGALGFEAQLQFQGIQMPDELEAALEDIETGARPYPELWALART